MKVKSSIQANKIKTALHLDSHPRKQDGKHQFMLRVYLGNRKYIYIRTGRYMLPKYWVEKKITSGKGNPNASKLKVYLDDLVSKCERIVNGILEKGKAITKRQIEKDLFGNKLENCNANIPFIAYIKEVNDRELKSGNISQKRVWGYNAIVKHLDTFEPEILLSEIDGEWLSNFEIYLKERALSFNTICVYTKGIVKILNYAVERDEILPRNPLKKFRPKNMVDGDKEFLTVDELHRLHNLFISEELLMQKRVLGHVGKTLHRCLQLFLVGCYTGLRFSDIVKLKRSDFRSSILRVKMVKTQKQNKWVSIPVTDPLKDVLNLSELEERGSLFLGKKPLHNTAANTYIKKIAQYAEIDKHLTFHCSRHTFACVALELGLSLEVVSETLGHATLRQTKTYAKMQALRIKDEMLAFNAFSKRKPTRIRKVS